MTTIRYEIAWLVSGDDIGRIEAEIARLDARIAQAEEMDDDRALREADDEKAILRARLWELEQGSGELREYQKDYYSSRM